LVFSTCTFLFDKVNTSCTPCTLANCFSCLDGPICSQCITNHILDSSSTICTPCPSRQYEDYNVCHPCVSKCTSCQVSGSNVVCNSCDPNFVVHLDTLSCVDCKSVTFKCIDCYDMLTCTLCEYPYILGSTGKCDQCENGFDYLDGLCVKPSGCVSFLSNYTKCLACASNHHFVYSEAKNSCVCENGYRLTDTGRAKVCLAECGNGITSFPDEDCDDGNTKGNDGCDQNCKRESGFTCTPSSPAQCYLEIKI
jgi:cysteine-rich repeat protein